MDDPGWPPLRMVLMFVVPGTVTRYARTQTTRGNGLVVLRAVFLSFVTALVLFAIVLAFIGGAADQHVVPYLPALAVVALASIPCVALAQRRTLAGESPTALGRSYRERFFTVVAINEAVALVGFVFTFVGGPFWIYDAAAAFALYRLWTTAAPTRTSLARDQAALDARGCGISLVAALQGSAR